jgi:hypothetical protein
MEPCKVGTGKLSSRRRMRLVIVSLSWVALAVAALVSPVLVMLSWPVSIVLLLWASLGSTADLLAAFALREPIAMPPRYARALTVLLVALAACGIAGTVASLVPSMAWRSKSGDIVREYGISTVVAPALWTAILVTAMRALALRSPRRFATVAVFTIVAWPMFLGIGAVSEPWFDIDNQFMRLAPHVLDLYVASAIAASGIAIAVALITARLAAGPVITAPPLATVNAR